MSDTTTVQFGYCPDADDAYMYYALAEDRIDTGELRVVPVVESIYELNKRAGERALDLTTLSLHAYARHHDRYDLLSCGGNVLDGTGPILAGRRDLNREQLGDARVAVPGPLTTANLVLQIYAEERVETVTEPFDRILDLVRNGTYEAGLIIDQNQLLMESTDLVTIVDLGTWWKRTTRLPLPVAACAVRSDHREASAIGSLVRESIDYAFSHRVEALDYAEQFAPDLDRDQLERYVDLYVNDHSRDFGNRGRRAVQQLLNQAYEHGLIDEAVNPVFVQVS